MRIRRPHGHPRPLRFWMAVALIYLVVAALLTALDAPSAHLLAGLAAGAVCAMGTDYPLPAPSMVRRLSMGIVGVKAGSMIDFQVLHMVVQEPMLTLGGSVATLVITMGVGQLLRLSRGIDQPTAMFASIAGGASGVTAIARELDADEAIVVSVQYLRVMAIIFTVPLIAPLLDNSGTGRVSPATNSFGWDGLPYTVLALLVGLGLAQFLRFTASQLILPLAAAMTLSLTVPFPSTQIPEPVLAAGFAGIGVMVGLELTRRTLRRASRLLPLALVTFVLGIPACALVGLAFSTAGASDPMTGYLATSPAGLSAVIAVAVEQQGNVGLVVSCQAVRLVMALLMAALLGSYLRWRAKPPDEPTGSTATP
jgi:uncharacterized protein